jgi:hypothetical protein
MSDFHSSAAVLLAAPGLGLTSAEDPAWRAAAEPVWQRQGVKAE